MTVRTEVCIPWYDKGERVCEVHDHLFPRESSVCELLESPGVVKLEVERQESGGVDVYDFG